MRTWAMERTVVAIGLGIPLLATGALVTAQGGGRGERIADAKPGDVRVLATAAIRIPLDAVRAEASKAIGHRSPDRTESKAVGDRGWCRCCELAILMFSSSAGR